MFFSITFDFFSFKIGKSFSSYVFYIIQIVFFHHSALGLGILQVNFFSLRLYLGGGNPFALFSNNFLNQSLLGLVLLLLLLLLRTMLFYPSFGGYLK